METKKDFKNSLLQRREIVFALESDKNPSFPEMTKKIAEDFKAAEDCILIEGINGAYGSKSFVISASIYDSKEQRDKSKAAVTKAKALKAA